MKDVLAQFFNREVLGMVFIQMFIPALMVLVLFTNRHTWGKYTVKSKLCFVLVVYLTSVTVCLVAYKPFIYLPVIELMLGCLSWVWPFSLKGGYTYKDCGDTRMMPLDSDDSIDNAVQANKEDGN